MKINHRPWLLSLILAALLAAVYGFTLAPGYTWANRAADAGDLITAAYTGGVAHPPGYPTYLLLARLFQYLPFGTLALRTNLLSALCGVLAALLVMDLICRIAPGDRHLRSWAGLIAGLAFGLSPLFWSQAVITEVYTLHVLLIALILWLIFAPLTEVRLFSKVGLLNTATWRERLIGLLFGLGLGNQLTIILMLPAWLLFDWDTVRIFSKIDRSLLFRRLGWVLAGALLVYLTIPWRARGDSPVNWGGADDWRGFWWLLSGQLYQGELFGLGWAEFVERLGAWAALLKDQFGWIGLALSLYGLASIWHRRALAAVTLWMGAAYSVFALVYAVEDYYVMLLPFYLACALWLGAGAARLLSVIQAWRGWAVSLGVVLLLGMVGLNAARHYVVVDASQEREAVTFAQSVLSRVPRDGMLMTTQDEDTFVLWYYHYALGHRPDLIILHDGLLAYDWYRQAMLDYYPKLKLPSTGWDCLACAVKEVPRLNQRPYCQITPDENHALLCW